jgi:hypothetical protein
MITVIDLTIDVVVLIMLARLLIASRDPRRGEARSL